MGNSIRIARVNSSVSLSESSRLTTRYDRPPVVTFPRSTLGPHEWGVPGRLGVLRGRPSVSLGSPRHPKVQGELGGNGPPSYGRRRGEGDPGRQPRQGRRRNRRRN